MKQRGRRVSGRHVRRTAPTLVGFKGGGAQRTWVPVKVSESRLVMSNSL